MKHILYILSILIITLSSCSKDLPSTILAINLTHTVDGNKLLIGSSCGESGECHIDEDGNMPCCAGEGYFPYTNSANEKYNIQTLKYIISNIQLHNENDNTTLLKDIHFADLSDALTLQFDAGELSNGDYTNLSFTMGLANSINLSDAYLNEAWHATMAWPNMMGGGYHYMKLEGSYNYDSTFYNTHTGGTGGMDHSFNVTLPINLNLNNNLGNISININMEVNNWYKNPNTYNLSPSIMDDMSKQMELKDNGVTDVFSISTN